MLVSFKLRAQHAVISISYGNFKEGDITQKGLSEPNVPLIERKRNLGIPHRSALVSRIPSG